jgi:hypothetical protein
MGLPSASGLARSSAALETMTTIGTTDAAMMNGGVETFAAESKETNSAQKKIGAQKKIRE